MAQVVVRVLASADPSLRTVIESFAKTSKRAGDVVARDAGRVAKERVKIEGQLTKELEREEQKRTKAALKESQKREREAVRAARAIEQASAKEVRQRVRAHRQAERETVATYNKIQTVAGNAFGTTTRIAKAAVGMVTGFAGGIGVDVSPTAQIGKSVSFEKAIVDASNSGAKGAATPADIAKNRAAVEGAAGATKTDLNDMAGALQVYTGLTGDIESGRAALEMFGKISRATGADLRDVAGAAAQIANGLGNVPDKARIIEEALRVVVQQGKLGAVEIAALATHMGKFASKAQFYEGSREQTIARLGALAQISMKGGASTAREAASAAGNFDRDISTDAAKEAFDKYGVERRVNGRLRNPIDIIVDSLKATGGDGEKLQEMFRNQSSRKAVLGAAGIYNEAGGGKEGEDAVRQEFDKLLQTISAEDVEKAFQNSANTVEAKATELNNKYQQTMGHLLEKLMPAFERMVPSLEKLGDVALQVVPALAGIVEWAAANPLEALGIALAASVAKAGLGEVLKNAITGSMSKGGAGGLNIANATVAIAAGYLLGEIVYDKLSKQADADNNMIGALERDIQTTMENLKGGANPRLLGVLNDQIKQMEKVDSFGLADDKEGFRKEIADAKNFRDRYVDDLVKGGDPLDRMLNPEQSDESKIESTLASMNEAQIGALKGLLSGTLSVNVVNMPAGGFGPNSGPGVDPGGRIQ